MSKKTTEPSAVHQFNEGIRCFNKPDGVAAIRAFEAVIRIDPSYRHEDGDNPYFYLGKIAEIEGRIEDAVHYYSSALKQDPYDEESLIGRGSCRTVQKDHDAAVADFKKVLEIPSEIRNAPLQHVMYAIAENHRQQKEFAKALHWGEKALALEPDNPRHQQLVADAKQQMGN